jgi:hypothetical protein
VKLPAPYAMAVAPKSGIIPVALVVKVVKLTATAVVVRVKFDKSIQTFNKNMFNLNFKK